MKLCWFDDHRLGLVRGDQVLDVTRALDSIELHRYPRFAGDPVIEQLSTLRIAVDALAKERPPAAKTHPVQSVKFLSPVARPTKIVGTPANYLKHVEEAQAQAEVFTRRYSGAVKEQGLFLKAVSALVGPSQGVSLRFPERRTDHEMELGVVIGKPCSRVREEDALGYVAGYAIALDMVVRGPEDRSFRKSVDSYAVLGPWLVTRDEIADPQALGLSLAVNGAARQASNTRFMILSIAQQIAWASEYYTLWPGDIIMTGTCEGVGQVHAGDVMRCEIDQIGAMDVRVHGA